ncbi:protein RALF-like 34 [Mercurialis annua]|uniref:protein RALF-like 34 n=1 Tax=Mercurialis annua TaxID=3986 RepID=UPI00215DD658|nr:protein RALF-like 34 [Mercurialis annua]
MAIHKLALLLVLTLITSSRLVSAQLITDWPSMASAVSMYGDLEDNTESDLFDVDGDDDDGEIADRRSLIWRRFHYYISYGALSANRIPCPPRSGRSYYTHNCFKSRAAVNPYTRGCSRITRCRR